MIQANTHMSETSDSLKGLTVLIVDDTESVRHAITEYLQREGCHVIEAQDGRDAMELCSGPSHQIDLILIDINMPQMDGIELSKKIHWIAPDIKILFISSPLAKTQFQEEIPRHLFLEKPFNSSDLCQKLSEVFKRCSLSA
jgi:CheY-like chemotaxis protein